MSVASGLENRSRFTPLLELGLWELLVATIQERERENLRFDPAKLRELEAAALENIIVDPLQEYLDDPIRFLRRVSRVTLEAECSS